MRIIRPTPGWLRLLWSESLPAQMQQAVEVAAEIPGCYLGQRHFDAPTTATMLPEVQAVFGDVDACEPARWYYREPFEPARPLYVHQREGEKFLLEYSGGLLCDEMGLGKTSTAAVAAERLRRGALSRFGHRPGVIVGPLFARMVWLRELLALGIIDDPYQFCAITSQDLNDPCFRRDARWYFIHYDVARFWWSRLMPLKPAVAIVDEAHWVSNGRAKRSVATGMLVLPVPHRILLTGTPLEKKPSDLWWLLTLVSGTHTWGGPLDFRKRYCGAQPNDFGGHVDGEPTHVEELRARLARVMLRRTEADAGLEMPPLTRTMLPVQLTNAGDYQEEASRVQVRDIVAAILAGNVEQVLPAYSRLRALTSRGKLAATVEQVRNALDQGASVVVFCWARQTVRTILSHVNAGAGVRYRSGSITGEDEQAHRDEIVADFQASTEPGVIVATYGALKEGVTLHRARVVIMHDLDLTIGAMLQAEKRIHRIGQHRACQSLWMLAENSVDTLVAPILQRKAQLLNSFFDGDVLPELEATMEPEDVGAAVDRAMSAWGGSADA